MTAKGINEVIITGAGFSAPANLPIQSRIINRMTQVPPLDFLSGLLPQESLKFLHAYITVGLFLLDNYAKTDYSYLRNYYWQVRKCEEAFDVFRASKFESEKSDWETNITFFSHQLSSNEYTVDKLHDDYYALLYSIRNQVREAMITEKIGVNLEDIFTAFDKSVNTKEYLHQYTYTQMDEIRYSIMRLFIYYFSKGVQDHSFSQPEYLNFFKYLGQRVGGSSTTIITTNWDTLIEEYCSHLDLSYNYGFQKPYTSNGCTGSDPSQELLLLKIHGSINWLRCLHCGSISVFEKSNAASSLFSDEGYERCIVCSGGKDSSDPSLQPEIITPTMVKSLTTQLYSNIWGTASRELQKATHIIFIGYSLPIADFDFRYMLQRCIPKSATIDVILTNNDNPAQTTNESFQALLPEKRYRDAFPKNDITFFYDGFEKYFQQITS